MALICLKYLGLTFNYIFETKSFVFIPQSKVELADSNFLDKEEFFSCIYDKNSEFYVLLKEPIERDISIEDFVEEYLHKFKFLEAIINLLFSNYLRRDYIFVLEKEASEYVVKSIFKHLSNNNLKVNKTLLWKNSIFTKFLEEIIDKSFAKFDSITLKEDFATRFAFSVDMYIRGKFGENLLRSNSDLWISLEVLSVITISRILHSHGTFKGSKFVMPLQKIVKHHLSKNPLETIDCWPPMKEDFSDHIANKINSHLPILKKCIKVAEDHMKVEDIKVQLQTETSDNFKDYQEKMKIKKILETIYNERNALFHEGKVSENWSLESDRIKANFIKILEQLFFRILGLEMITYYQMGYPYQYIFGIPIKEGEFKNLGRLTNLTWIYMHKNYVEPLHTDYKNPFNYQPVKEKYIESTNEFDPLRVLLNSTVEKILNFLNSSHPIQVLVDGASLNTSLNYQYIKKKKAKLSFALNSGIIPIVYDKKQVIIKNQDNNDISSMFFGMFVDEIRYGSDSIKVPFRINPPYISFRLS